MSGKPDLKAQMAEFYRLLDTDQSEAAMALKASIEDAFRHPIPLPEMYRALPAVLVLTEKEETSHIWARTPDEYAIAGLDVLQSRLCAGHYYLEAELPDQVPKDALSSSGVFLLDTILAGLSELASTGSLPLSGSHSFVMKAIFATQPGNLLRDSLATSAVTRAHLFSFWHDALAEDGQLPMVQMLTAILVEVFPGHRGVQAGMAAHLRQSRYNEAMAPVIANLPVSEADRVRRILDLAKEDGGLRRAGRMAHDFLASRRRHQYEAVQLVQPETPSFP